MLESTTMEMGKLFVSVFIIFSMVSLTLFFSEVNQANEYKQYVNYQIERNGGLTSEAIKKIEDYNKEHFGGEFEVQSSQMNQQFPFGQEVSYKVNATHEFLFLPIVSREISLKGAAISQVR
ncbi:hypothetical protein [Pontibacillus litoralis]|uniref:DUF4320 domain-containing protein n=1 Tax=Pontibacillus litoralis JSM 072002 TaxID=1385512 RepID=A0A0A5HNG8_9BACI|nr:hypothetical protein [Pontibacillus litoralis]KGX85187.1 hypothetical protein N784_09835 [Pontibacillus litoralis JSM 072002]